MAIKKNTPNYLKKTQQPFTTLINKTIELIPDAAAVGIYVYLSSKQNDWIIQEKDLMNRFGAGRDFIRSKMKILKESGLLIKEAARNDKGQITHWETILLNHITEKPPSGKSRHLENPTLINKRSNEINVDKDKISASDEAANLVYNDFDNQDEKFDSCDNQTLQIPEGTQFLWGEVESLKSDYFDTQIKKETKSKLSSQYALKDMLSENIFNIPEDIILDFIENRKKKRVPITKTAWNRINKELSKCKEEGIDPIDAFETMVAAGWQSMKVDYFITKDTQTKKEAAKKRTLDIERMANEQKQREIEDSKRRNGTIKKASEEASNAFRKAVGLPPRLADLSG